MLFERLFGRFRFRRKPPSTWDINQALRWAYQTGWQNGEKQKPPVVYARFCEAHQVRLHELQPGLFLCPLCRDVAQQETDPLQLTKRPFLAYREASHVRPGSSTEMHRAQQVPHSG